MKPWIKTIIRISIGACFGGAILITLGLSVLVTKYHNRIYPGITVSQVSLGGLTQDQAEIKLNQAVDTYLQSVPNTFADQNGNAYTLHFDSHTIHFDTEAAAATALQFGRELSLQSMANLIRLPHQPADMPIQVVIDQAWFDTAAASLSAQIDVPVIPPQLRLVGQGAQQRVEISLGHNGLTFNQAGWRQSLLRAFSTLSPPAAELPIDLQIITTTADQIKLAEITATALIQSSLTLTFIPDNQPLLSREWQLTGSELIDFIRFDDAFDRLKIEAYLQGVAEAVNQPPRDAKFQFNETTGKVAEFVPAENGIVIDTNASAELIYQALSDLAAGKSIDPVNLVSTVTAPAVTLSDVNRLGIKEKIGVGTSTYTGSIPARVHNVALAATYLNGTLIKPGEEFSFNQTIGEISAATGYKAAYIIQNGRTELGDGGGICQDSTTMFRAALDAGLPITSRRGHAYRVGYYEQDAKPGLDATVFSPVTDFKFMNDTPGHILIQAHADSANRRLTITLYGTSDGRNSQILDHILWDVTPPPPDVYIDDPTLAPGQVKQIDWRAPGGKAKFTYKVTRDGEVLQEKTFVSSYRPWAAVYLRGPQP